MSPTVIAFIRSSLIYLAIGITMGILMILRVLPDAAAPQYITMAHAHVNLLGWVSMLMFGVGYHILPRFSGRPLHSEGAAKAQLWLTNIGLAAMVIMLFVDAYVKQDILLYGVAPFGVMYAVGAYLFVYNLWKTLAAAMPVPMPPGAAGGKQ